MRAFIGRSLAFGLALPFGALLALAVSVGISAITNAHVQEGPVRLGDLRTSWAMLEYVLWIAIAICVVPWLLRPLSVVFGAPMVHGNRASKFAEKNRIASLLIFFAAFAALLIGIVLFVS